MELWREVWREGIGPTLSTAGLEALGNGLLRDDPDLLQGLTVSPLPGPETASWLVRGACALGYCAWQGEQLRRVDEVEEYYHRICAECDAALGPDAHRHFTRWFDCTPRPEVRRLLLGEIFRELVRRLRVACPESQFPAASNQPTAASA